MCSCIDYLVELKTAAEDEEDRLRKKFAIYGRAHRDGEGKAAARLIAKLEYDASYLDSIIHTLKLKEST